MEKLFAISSFFVKENNYNNYTDIVLVIIGKSKSEAIGKFLLSDDVKSTLNDGYTMIGNQPVCAEIDIDHYLKKSEWLSENGYIKDIDDVELQTKGTEEYYNSKETFSY